MNFAKDPPMSMLLLAAADPGLSLFERMVEPFRYHPIPLLVSTIMGAMLGLVGCFVVLRRMALLGDALSHAVLPGVVLAFIVINAFAEKVTGTLEMTGLFMGALFAGLLTTGGVSLIARHTRVKEDSAIGIAFTAMFAIGVIMISSMPKGAHFDLKCFLWGEVLAIKEDDVLTMTVVSVAVLALVLLFYRPLKLMSFDPQMAAAAGLPVHFLHYLLMGMLSAVIVAALQSVGVIMSVAMLITPAAIAYQLTNRFGVMLVLSAAAGGASALLGLDLAFVNDWPPGPAMVVVATILFALTMAFAPEYGVLSKAIRRRRVRAHILEEDVLKWLRNLGSEAELTRVQTAMGTQTSEVQLTTAIDTLAREGAVERTATTVRLTPRGAQQADRLVRSHRLWETYLADKGVPQERIHEEAERLEHAHDIAEEVAAELGHPEIDPHGEPIPKGNASADS